MDLKLANVKAVDVAPFKELGGFTQAGRNREWFSGRLPRRSEDKLVRYVNY